MLTLREVVKIRTGSTEKLDYQGQEVEIIRMRNIDHQLAKIDWSTVEKARVESQSIKPLELHDILVVAKGERNTAVLVNQLSAETIATNHFFVLSLNRNFQNSISPEYLVWFLNYPSKNYFEINSIGAVIPNLRKDTLGNLRLVIPPIPQQNIILNTFQQMLMQKEIYEELFIDRLTLLTQHALSF